MTNEKGLTLVEVLAAFAIGTIFLLLIGSTLMFGLKQYKSQSTEAQQLTDVTIVAKVITKDIRKSHEVKIDGNNSILQLIIGDETVEYKLNETQHVLLKNGSELFSGIHLFKLEKESRKLKLTIESTTRNGQQETIQTEIYIREAVRFEDIY